ncbi:MAG: hypothetical protein Q9193_001624 [Seirophora villosa]
MERYRLAVPAIVVVRLLRYGTLMLASREGICYVGKTKQTNKVIVAGTIAVTMTPLFAHEHNGTLTIALSGMSGSLSLRIRVGIYKSQGFLLLYPFLISFQANIYFPYYPCIHILLHAPGQAQHHDILLAGIFQQESTSKNNMAAFRTPKITSIPASDLCHDVACPIKAPHAAGGYRSNVNDPKQAHLPAPPRPITLALAAVNFRHDEKTIENLAATELLAKFDLVHAGWATVPVKKQPARKGRGKRPEWNWQAARQNGPKPLVIGKGKKVEAAAKVVAPRQAPVGGNAGRTPSAKTISTAAPASTPATSVADDSSVGGVKIA